MSQVEPLLMIGLSRAYQPGDYITVDDRPAVIRRVMFDSCTVLRAEIEVYESADVRDEANRG